MNLNELLADLEQSAGLEKTAGAKPEKSVAPAIKSELASVLEKKAEQDLTKQAFEEGSTLAKMLLEKLANEIQVDNAIMEASDDKKVVPINGSTIEGTLQGTVDQAVARGAESDDRVDPVLDKEAQLTKQAQENKTMAKSIMNKLAQMVGEPTTAPAAAVNVAGAAVPNMVQVDNAGMTAFDDAKVTPLPGTEGTINNILEALVAKAKSEGAGSANLVDGQGAVEGAVALGSPEDQVEKAAAVNALVGEGMDFDTAVGLVKQAEAEILGEAKEQEKVAAVNALADAGYDFETAVELVKQAEAEIAQEEDALEKMAYVQGLMDEGYDFDQAVELVKEAGVKETALSKWKELSEATKKHYGTVENWVHGQGVRASVGAENVAYGIKNKNMGIATRGVKQLAKNHLVQGGAAVTAGGAGYAAYRSHEKKAALEALVAEGIDFETATDLVKQAEYEVYGE